MHCESQPRVLAAKSPLQSGICIVAMTRVKHLIIIKNSMAIGGGHKLEVFGARHGFVEVIRKLASLNSMQCSLEDWREEKPG